MVENLSSRAQKGVADALADSLRPQIHRDDEALATETLMAVFLVLCMRVGNLIQQSRYEAEHSAKLDSYRMARALAEIQETGVTPEVIRERLALPDPPDPCHALAELFATDNGETAETQGRTSERG